MYSISIERPTQAIRFMILIVIGCAMSASAQDSSKQLDQAEEDVVQRSGLPSFVEADEEVPTGVDEPAPVREEEVFGQENEEILVQPELEEGEVVERGRVMVGTKYSAYSANQLSAKAMRIPINLQPACGDKVITRSVNAYPLSSKVHGDKEMGGNKVMVLIEGETEHSNARVFVRGAVMMREQGGNRSEFRHTFDHVIFDATREAPGCRITSLSFHNYYDHIKPREGGRILGYSPKNSHSFRTYYPPKAVGSGEKSKWQLFSSARCRADTNGTDGGKIGCNQIQVRPLVVHLAPIENGKACQRVQFHLPANAMSMYNRGFRDLFPIARVGGDSTLNGKATGFAIARVEWNQNGVQLYHRVRIRENGGDHSTYDSASRSTLIEAAKDAPGCKIKSVSGTPLNGRADFSVDNKWWLGHSGSGLLERVWCRVNSNAKKDDWRLGCIKFEYKGFLNIEFE